MIRNMIRGAAALALTVLALPGVAWAADTAVKAVRSCCGGCPLGCC